MKTRIIQTDFWNDEKIQSMSLCAQHLYIFLLTCPFINICGIFKCSKGLVRAMTCISSDQLSKAMNELEENKKAFFYNGWIFVKNARQKNGYENSQKNISACQKEISLIPPGVKEHFNKISDTTMDTTIDTTTDSSHKSEINNINISNITNHSIKKGGVGGNLKSDFQQYIESFNSIFNRQFLPTTDKFDKYKIRRKEFSSQEILTSLQRMASQPFYLGQNDRKWTASPEYHLRNETNVRRFLEDVPATVEPKGKKPSVLLKLEERERQEKLEMRQNA